MGIFSCLSTLLCKFMRQTNVDSAMCKDRISLVILFNTASKYEPQWIFKIKKSLKIIGKHSAEHYYSTFEFISVSPLRLFMAMQRVISQQIFTDSRWLGSI